MSANDQVNILLVDDQPGKLLSYEVILGELNENLIKANSAKEALQYLLKHEIAVVLVDACMPEMDGFELVEMIRKHPRCERTAIILVSAVFQSDIDRVRGYGAGAVDYVPVPVVPEVLRAKVSVFADLYRKTEQLARLNAELERRVAERTAELEASATHLRESEERFRTLASHAPVGIFMTDLDGNCQFVNETWCEMAGICAPEALGKGWLGAIHPQDRGRIESEWTHALASQSTFEAENRMLRPDGRVTWVQGSAVALKNAAGFIIGYIGTVIDITDRKLADEDRTRLLESEREARGAAEEANRLKDEFLASLSHELRTPINAVLGWVQLMSRGTLDAASTQEGLQVIDRGIRTQVRLIDELLDVNRISSGKFRINDDAVDLGTVINAAIETVLPDVREKQIRLNRAPQPDTLALRGDATRLQQVFWNLLTNSVKFTPRGGEVNVAYKTIGPNVEVTVSDNGQGIKPEFLPHVFERFRQGDSSTTRRHGGLGLGLAIAKYIVEMHRGSIRAESDGEGRGARFIVTLPAAVSARGDVTPIESQLNLNLEGVKVLVVDDDRATREIVARTLIEYGGEARTVEGADEALAEFAGWRPDVMVCDIGMPGKDGYELIRELRLLPGGAVPAIALTAYTRAEDRMRALTAGYTMHLPKPINPQQLIVAVCELARTALASAARTA